MQLNSVSFESRKELKKFVNENSIPKQNIVSIVCARKPLPGGPNWFGFIEWDLFYYE